VPTVEPREVISKKRSMELTGFSRCGGASGVVDTVTRRL
jgi:hypothetical protein